MYNLSLLDESFNKFYRNISHGSPEAVINVNLKLLHQMGLLRYHTTGSHESTLTRYFQVFETPEKITLVNDDFVIWIVPEKTNGVFLTSTLIALNHSEGPHLELIFVNSGVYNTSRLVLQILEKFLCDIQENEDFLSTIK